MQALALLAEAIIFALLKIICHLLPGLNVKSKPINGIVLGVNTEKRCPDLPSK